MTAAGPRRRLWAAVAAAWAIGVVVVWNAVFDARIRAGASDYVDRQQAWIDGRGPRADMGQAMDAARAAGLHDASLWAGAAAAPGLILAGWRLRRRGTR